MWQRDISPQRQVMTVCQLHGRQTTATTKIASRTATANRHVFTSAALSRKASAATIRKEFCPCHGSAAACHNEAEAEPDPLHTAHRLWCHRDGDDYICGNVQPSHSAVGHERPKSNR
ncbi:hypothetical protein MY3296_003584 [Beauveria thailandica]